MIDGYGHRGRKRARRRRLWAARTLSLVGLVAALAAVWALTEQSAEGTSRLSASTERVASEIVASAAGVANEAATAAAAPATDFAAAGAPSSTGNAAGATGTAPAEANPEAAGDDAPEAPDLSKLPSAAAFWLQRVRRVAHAVEFAAVGLFASLAAIAWREVLGRGRAASPRALLAGTLALCAVCSLVDQTHKVFVPGRHFDVKDLPFDLAGYLVATLVVFAVWAQVRRLRAGRPTRYTESD